MAESLARVGDGIGLDETKPTSRAGFKLVAKLVRPHMGPFATSVVGAGIFAGATVLSASVLGWVTDSVVLDTFEGDDVSVPTTAAAGALAVLAVAIIRAVGVVTRRYFAGMTSERVERQTRAGLTKQYLDQPMSWIRSAPTGRLIAHVDADTAVLTEALHPLPFSFGVIFLAVFSGISLVRIDPWIALFAVIVFPVMMAVNSVYSRIVEKPLSTMQAQVAQVAGIAHESFEGALVVKTLGRQRAEHNRFATAVEGLRDRRQHVGFIRTGVEGVLNAFPPLATLAVVMIGAYRIQAGSMSPGDVVTVAALFAALAIPMHVFGFLLESLIPSVVAWNRLRPVIEAPTPEVPASAGPPTVGALSVTVNNLTYCWPDAPDETVLDTISLHIAPGELIAIVGPTGSGKSTLCAAIAGVLDDAGHAVSVGGRDMTDFNPDDRATAIAYVFQEAFLFAETIRANIDLDDRYSEADIRDATRVAAIDEWIDSLEAGLDTVMGERGVTVSGGQRQRIALARALVGNAGLVILDDATSAVDPVIERQILDHLRTGTDATMLVVANRLATIGLADRVVYLANGAIAGIGNHDELLKNPEYHALAMAYAEASDV